MIELLEKTTPDSDSDGINETNTMTLLERYSVEPEDIEQQIGRVIMDRYTISYVMSGKRSGYPGPIDSDDEPTKL